MLLFYQQTSGKTSLGRFLILPQKSYLATCITKARIAITTATIQFMHLVLARGIGKQLTPIL